MTVLATGERGEKTLTRFGLEEYIADCVVLLDHRVTDHVSTRSIRVSGWEFREAQQRNERLAAIPVVVLSATGERARPIEVARILRKPVTLETLLATVKEVAVARKKS